MVSGEAAAPALGSGAETLGGAVVLVDGALWVGVVFGPSPPPQPAATIALTTANDTNIDPRTERFTVIIPHNGALSTQHPMPGQAEGGLRGRLVLAP